ncbi:unnamed protein product, partial [Linum tenue]
NKTSHEVSLCTTSRSLAILWLLAFHLLRFCPLHPEAYLWQLQLHYLSILRLICKHHGRSYFLRKKGRRHGGKARGGDQHRTDCDRHQGACSVGSGLRHRRRRDCGWHHHHVR